MKKLLLLLLILCLLPVSAMGTQVLTVDYITLADAIAQLESASDPTSQLLKSRLEPFMLCQGRYVHPPEPGSKTYVADVTFYLKKGEVWVNVDYTNYAGTLSDAPVTAASEPGYHYHAAPTGSFYGSEQLFSISFAPDSLLIRWADDIEYRLIRGDGTENTADPPFEETDFYDTLMESLGKNFAGYAHRCVCDEETKTVYVYLAMGQSGMYDSFAARAGELHQTWQTIVDGVTPYCQNMHTAVGLALRKGITDVTPAHFVFTIVETLRAGDDYPNALCVIEDGRVTYDRMDEVLHKPSNPGTQPAATTLGQQNALRRAHDYLDFTHFSHSGLVDQLEYEGFTAAEARYGADWCGANWYQQAARSAKSYLDLKAFSRQGLLDQLAFEGFTADQALYAVTQNGY